MLGDGDCLTLFALVCASSVISRAVRLSLTDDRVFAGARLRNTDKYAYTCAGFLNGVKRFFSPDFKTVDQGRHAKSWTLKEEKAIVG